MTSIILSIGDELVLGQTVDTNSAWLSQQLAGIGLRVIGHVTEGDDQAACEAAIRSAAARCEVLLISGGLGPTEDDLTRQALAGALGQPLEMNAQAIQSLTMFFSGLGRTMPESNKIQAMIPRGATLIENTCGTAPGIDATYRSGRPGHHCHIFVMPGVPKEMKVMFSRDVLPHLQSFAGGAAIASRVLHTFGLGESHLAEKLGTLMTRGRNPSVGTTVAAGIVSLRINSYFETHQRAAQEADRTCDECRAALGDLIFGQDAQTLATVVAGLLLESEGRITLATAESCTGGLLAKMLTDIPGSSSYFQRGWITYSNAAKTQMLGVPASLIDENGAVSEPVASSMAEKARSAGAATIALSITGIAGPGGGTADKPVGTVCIGLSHESGNSVRTFRFSGDRDSIRDRSAKMALMMLRFHLLGKPLPF